jgi:hypothetical protein
MALGGELLDGVVARMTRPDYARFEAQLRSSGYCAHPVRLRGRIDVCDGHGVRQQVWSTHAEPDGLLRKACGNRREAICRPCAQRYRGDAWQIIAAGLRGGKGIPESVIGHPALFASLTAPSFGVVHAQLLGPDGKPLRCRPRRDAPVCPHGVALSCSKTHAPDDPCVGEPLCPACFDYTGAVIWNNLLGELWRRTTIYLPRKLAKLTRLTQERLHALVRVSYVKVSEYQRRGLVHLHPTIRLDRRMPTYRAHELRPPDRRFTPELLEQALRDAVQAVFVQAPEELGGALVRWGSQLDVQQLSGNDDERRRRASYLAKYTTKSTEQAGGLLQRVGRGDIDNVQVRPHVRRYLRTAFELHDQVMTAIRADEPAECMQRPAAAPTTSRDQNGLVLRVLAAMSTDERVAIRLQDDTEHAGRIVRRIPDGLVLDTGVEIALADVRVITTPPPPAAKRDPRDRRLAACAHAFGYRGHCLTKSRGYSMRFKDLREDRERHVHAQLLACSIDESQRKLAQLDPGQRITAFEFVGVGHLTTADAYLAAQAAARAREHRQLAREALEDHHHHRQQGRCGAPQDEPTATRALPGRRRPPLS